ncbi:hypothetical protein J7L60_07400 [Candidatus Bathyarchaeota archaeon]|nr:hypothetical protein [Candidatus Bathyarchaeota archaeon]
MTLRKTAKKTETKLLAKDCKGLTARRSFPSLESQSITKPHQLRIETPGRRPI